MVKFSFRPFLPPADNAANRRTLVEREEAVQQKVEKSERVVRG